MLLYPALPFSGRDLDPAYAPEAEVAGGHGLPFGPLDYEALLEGDERRALRFLPPGEGSALVLRGWMLPALLYARLYAALVERGHAPLTSPDAYALTHHLSANLPLIADWTPRTAFVPLIGGAVDWPGVEAALKAFGPAPLIVRDYVKSRKHEWLEACFIPDASDLAQARRVIGTFAARQAESLTGGIALRAYEAFEPIGTHPRSGMPLTREHRLFFVRGQAALVSDYWETPNPAGGDLPLDDLTQLAAQIRSPFFSMDVARRVDGAWRVVELGDGQVAGLPERADAAPLYAALKLALESDVP